MPDLQDMYRYRCGNIIGACGTLTGGIYTFDLTMSKRRVFERVWWHGPLPHGRACGPAVWRLFAVRAVFVQAGNAEAG